MKKPHESKNRFPLSDLSPNEYPIGSNDDALCVDIALALGEANMRFILARRHQVGMAAINSCYATVKEYQLKGTCRSPAKLFNALLTKEVVKRKEDKNLPK